MVLIVVGLIVVLIAFGAAVVSGRLELAAELDLVDCVGLKGAEVNRR